MDEKELWVKFACAVIENYEIPDDVADVEELVDDMTELAGKTADAMLDEFEERYPPRAARARSGGGRTRKPRGERPETEPEPE